MKYILLLLLLVGCSEPVLKYKHGDVVHIDQCKSARVRERHEFHRCKLHGTVENMDHFSNLMVDYIVYVVHFECNASNQYFVTELR